jgi:hypothetical protein
MQPQRDGNGQEHFRAALPMGILFEKALDRAEIERAASELESEYEALVARLREQRALTRKNGVLAYWRFGDALVMFEQEHKATLLFVDRLVEHIVRDVDFSETMVLLCRRFREKQPDMAKLDAQQSFTNYYRAGFDTERLAAKSPRRSKREKRGTELSRE